MAPAHFSQRFQEFLGQVQSAETIDALDLTPEQKESEKADYFFLDREVICEFKSLESDTGHKIEDVIRPYMLREDWPIVAGASRPLSQVLKKFPDREEVKKKIHEALSETVERAIRKANSQIRSTKKTFNLPGAAGFLVFVNESVHSLHPTTIAVRIGQALDRTINGNEPRYPEIAAILLLHAAHVLQKGETPVVPLFAIENKLRRNERVNKLIDYLMPQWGVFAGIEMEKRDWGDLSDEFAAAEWVE